MKLYRNISILALTFALASCGGDGINTTTTTTGTTNTAPTVNAGTDQTVTVGTNVTLNSTASDADGDSLSYTWTQTSGTDVTLSSTTTADPTFTAPASATSAVFSLSVSDGTVTTTDTVTITVQTATTTATAAGWILNDGSKRSTEIFTDSTQSEGALFDIQSAQIQTVNGVEFAVVSRTNIPDYEIEATQEIIDELNNRPLASRDFALGSTNLNVGDTIVFGQDIGYGATGDNCAETGGQGYWPPGPACPVVATEEGYFTTAPTQRDEDVDGACETGIGTIGYLVNGAGIFGWGDTQSYNGDGVFQNLAVAFEIYDLDVCAGHSANGDYHQHSYGRCLQELVGDDGSAHSPLIGFAADGFPIYGPYESANTFALSGWVARDYGADASVGGCDTPDERTCVLVDQYDVDAGVEDAPTDGPLTTDVITSQSGNSVIAISGSYFEDFYYTGATVAGAQLDQYNGHDSGDGKGYHYHFTQKLEGGVTKLAFPYTFGPRYRGDIPDNAVGSCGSEGGGTMGPGGR